MLVTTWTFSVLNATPKPLRKICGQSRLRRLRGGYTEHRPGQSTKWELAVRANQIVSMDELAEVVWDGAPPTRATRTIQVYIARLRKTLGVTVPSRIATRPPGYLWKADQSEVDLLEFENLCRQGGQSTHERDWAAGVQIARGNLIEQLAIEPGPDLRLVHHRVLAGDTAPIEPSPPAPAPSTLSVPHMLPAAAPCFTMSGRHFSSFIEQILWPQRELILFLKDRKPAISITDEDITAITDTWSRVYELQHAEQPSHQ